MHKKILFVLVSCNIFLLHSYFITCDKLDTNQFIIKFHLLDLKSHEDGDKSKQCLLLGMIHQVAIIWICIKAQVPFVTRYQARNIVMCVTLAVYTDTENHNASFTSANCSLDIRGKFKASTEAKKQ